MIRYIDTETARQHLTDRLMESALNNVGIKVDADEVFRDMAQNRLPVWIDELQTYDVQEVRHGRWEGGEDAGKYCSVCHQRTLIAACMNATFDGIEYRQVITPFCMWCGARMDEVGDE